MGFKNAGTGRRISSNAAERQRDLPAMPITGIGFVSFSSKGVSQGGSAARADAPKNGSLDERRGHARRLIRASLCAFAMGLEALSCVIPGHI